MDSSKVKANTHGKMGKFILVNLKMVSNRVKENGEAQRARFRTVTATKVRIVMIRRMDMVSTNGLVVMYIMVITLTMKEVVKVPWCGPMAASMKENGTKAYSMVSVE